MHLIYDPVLTNHVVRMVSKQLNLAATEPHLPALLAAARALRAVTYSACTCNGPQQQRLCSQLCRDRPFEWEKRASFTCLQPYTATVLTAQRNVDFPPERREPQRFYMKEYNTVPLGGRDFLGFSVFRVLSFFFRVWR